MLVIAEDKFYQILDKYEDKEVKPLDDGYYPSIEEISQHLNERGELSAEIIDFLAYFNQNPYQGNEIYDDDEEYQKTLKYIDTVLKKNICIA